MKLGKLLFLGVIAFGLINDACPMDRSLATGHQTQPGVHLNVYAKPFVPKAKHHDVANHATPEPQKLFWVDGYGWVSDTFVKEHFSKFYAAAYSSPQQISAHSDSATQETLASNASGSDTTLATVASVQGVLTEARKSVHDLAGKDFDPLDKEVFDFLEHFVKEFYFPAILADLDGREAPKTWSDVFQEAINMKRVVQESYDASLSEFYDVVMNELSCTEDHLSERFNSIAPLFFKALFDVFASRGFGIEFTYWFCNATPYFYGLTIQDYPELTAPDRAYAGTTAFPVERGLLQAAQSMAGHAGAGLDDLEADECEQP